MTKKILIVDDEQHIRFLLHQTLEDFEDEGVEFFTASNGEEALEMIQNERPNLVFLDVMMPKMNGFEVCERVKHDTELREAIYIVILTAKGQQLDREKSVEVGADEYVAKPFEPDEIYEKAANILGIEE